MKFLYFFFAFILLTSGVGHFIFPELYNPMIPEWIPSLEANYGTGIIEIVVGILLLIPSKRSIGGFLFSFLMILFLPLHVWDLIREDPMVKPYFVAVVRLLLQFGLIAGGFAIWHKFRDFVPSRKRP